LHGLISGYNNLRASFRGTDMKKLAGIYLLVFMVLLTTSPVMGIDTCDLAADVAGKAYDKYNLDKAGGIRLFTKALDLCPDDPAYSYNLGIAYLMHKRPVEAVKYLDRAVTGRGDNPLWLNALSDALLQAGKPRYAALMAIRAGNIKKSPQSEDILARARFAEGNMSEGLEIISAALRKWPHSKELRKTHDENFDRYLAHYLILIKQGDTLRGLAGLSKVDFVVKGVEAYALALAGVDRLEESIEAIDKGLGRFGQSDKLLDLKKDVKRMIFDRMYTKFAKGQRKQALAEAKRYGDAHPNDMEAARVYNELFNAFINEAAANALPEPAKIAKYPSSFGESDLMLSDFKTGPSKEVKQSDLTIDIETNIPWGAVKKPDAIAVIIGNQRYSRQGQGIGDVSFAERDAKVMREYLLKVMGYSADNIIMEIDASLGKLNNIFGVAGRDGQLHNYVRQGKSDVFVYYVGHGAPGAQGTSAYLVPVDADVDYIANNGYDLDQLYKNISRLSAKSVTVVLDACFSGDSAAGPLFKNVSPAMLKAAGPVRDSGDAVVFAGAGQGQVCTWYNSKQHSMFTYFFLKGLGGEADLNKDKKVTTAEMKQYLAEEVPYMAQRKYNRKQEPQVKGPGDFVLVHLK